VKNHLLSMWVSIREDLPTQGGLQGMSRYCCTRMTAAGVTTTNSSYLVLGGHRGPLNSRGDFGNEQVLFSHDGHGTFLRGNTLSM
jgi:hypothetical protein